MRRSKVDGEGLICLSGGSGRQTLILLFLVVTRTIVAVSLTFSTAFMVVGCKKHKKVKLQYAFDHLTGAGSPGKACVKVLSQAAFLACVCSDTARLLPHGHTLLCDLHGVT